ncbi:MAG TPA: gluconate 2-dehydrogenase subunit 3 family protein [Pyrinomonadaceae bacterium]
MRLETLRAVVDCLIPPDDYAGAFDAGVCDFIVRLFETDLAEQREFFDAGLEAIESESLARFDTRFADLSPDQQVVILESTERGSVNTPWPIAPDQFFEILVRTTAEGYYSDPEQGGNKGSISWAMTGFQEV